MDDFKTELQNIAKLDSVRRAHNFPAFYHQAAVAQQAVPLAERKAEGLRS